MLLWSGLLNYSVQQTLLLTPRLHNPSLHQPLPRLPEIVSL